MAHFTTTPEQHHTTIDTCHQPPDREVHPFTVNVPNAALLVSSTMNSIYINTLYLIINAFIPFILCCQGSAHLSIAPHHTPTTTTSLSALHAQIAEIVLPCNTEVQSPAQLVSSYCT